MLSWFKKKFTTKEDRVGDEAGAAPPTDDVVAAAAPVLEEPKERAGLAQRLQERLAKTRTSLTARVDRLLLGRKVIDAELFDELEELLITADLGVATTRDLLDQARAMVARKALNDPAALKGVLKDIILAYLRESGQDAEMAQPAKGPFVIMVVGVNGVGKTTTIGKIAHKFVQAGQKVLLVAGDTFRAAAIDQLQVWGERAGVEVVARQSGTDPSSVVYEAMEQAEAQGFDVVLVDTAGRLHTKVNLMEELKKVRRVMAKKLARAPHEVLLVLDATTGQNSISQMRLFHEAVGVTGLALTKLDGTARGGIVVNLCHEFQVPIRFIGIGEQTEDLRDFDPEEFIAALFAGNGQAS
jgi:fused signal recognition particle receptor